MLRYSRHLSSSASCEIINRSLTHKSNGAWGLRDPLHAMLEILSIWTVYCLQWGYGSLIATHMTVHNRTDISLSGALPSDKPSSAREGAAHTLHLSIGTTMFAELHCQSSFSFLKGASQPEELVNQAVQLGYQALAITDECSLAGVVRAYRAARDTSMQLIIGSHFSITTDTPEPLSLILLSPCSLAYQDISALITHGRRSASKGHYKLHLHTVLAHANHALCLWLPGWHQQDNAHLKALSEKFRDRLWVTCELLQEDDDEARYQYLYRLAVMHHLPMVACNDVHMHVAQRQPLQDVLTAIRHGSSVAALGKRRFPNRERHLRSLQRLQSIYPPALLNESLHIAARCAFSLNELRYQYPMEVVPAGQTPADWLRTLVNEGAARRFPRGTPDNVQTQLDKELSLIHELKYEYYFLTVHDIVAFARKQGILCQGRGSAANSAVCYCLFITEVDPARSNLLFERFISRERDEPPDIDVDFEHERREEVIQFIYQKYGRQRAALAATVICYRLRSAIRDVGKALGIEKRVIDNLIKQLAWWDKPEQLTQRFAEAGLKNTLMASLYQRLVMEILGFPRHLSQHVGGFVISHEPLHTLVPIENAAMPERTIIQWDKDDLQTLGLMKVDVLALGMLSAIRRMLASVNHYVRDPLNIQDIPQEDSATYEMLCRGDSLGVFQVESRAQMNMLPRLRPRRFYDLVIQVAIVRPGPIQGDMVHPYLRRRAGQESISFPNPEIRNVLARTLGIPLFQEQVIQLAMVAAGFSGGEADQLRRAMARWGKSGELLQFQHRVIQGMLNRGYKKDYAQRLFEQIKGFGGYGFPESHAGSFALLVYISAWFKRHHGAAFYCGILNSLPMGFYAPAQLIQDARRHGIEVRQVDVMHSDWNYTLEDSHRYKIGMQPALRIGLRQISGLSCEAGERIQQSRHHKPFKNLQDLCHRAMLDQRDRQALAAGGALISLSGHRRQSHWEVLGVEDSRPLFATENIQPLRDGVAMDAPSEPETLLADYRSLGLTLGRHPLALLRHLEPFRHCQTARHLRSMETGRYVCVAGLVTTRQRPATASGVMFITLEDETGPVNVVLWKQIQEKFRRAVLSGHLLLIRGRLEKTSEGIIHLIANQVEDVTSAIAGLKTQSRNFH